MQEIQARFRGHMIRNADGRAIGRIRKNTAGRWQAVAFAGCSADEIDAVMDACQGLFALGRAPWKEAVPLVGARRRA
jgi:hypothetical protein